MFFYFLKMEMELPQEDLDIAFTEWTEKLDAGSNHWLPAYGYQQPSQLHEALFQQDFLNSGRLFFLILLNYLFIYSVYKKFQSISSHLYGQGKISSLCSGG